MSSNPAMEYRRFGKTEETVSVITLGGKKMVVISQETEEVRLKPFVKSYT